MNAARGHYLARQQDAAIAALRKAVALQPQSFEARFDLALASIATDVANPSNEKTADASAILDALLTEQPDHAAALYLAGVIRNMTGRGADAAPLLAKVASRGNPPAVVLHQYGVALRSAKQYDLAAEQFHKATQIDRFLAPSFYERAMSLRLTQGVDHPDVKAALTEFQALSAARSKSGLGPPNIIHCAHTRFMEPQAAMLERASVQMNFIYGTAQLGMDRGPRKERFWFGPAAVIPVAARHPIWLLLKDNMRDVWRLGYENGVWNALDPPLLKAIPDVCCIAFADVVTQTAGSEAQRELLLASDSRLALYSVTADGVATEHIDAFPKNIGGATRALWSDVDQDGDLDLLLITALKALRLLVNAGNGTFCDATEMLHWPGGGVHASDLAACDFDGDDLIDLLVSATNSDSIMLRGRGMGEFEPLQQGGTSPFPAARSGVVADWDGDGALDWILAIDNTVLAIKSDGTRQPVASLQPEWSANRLFAADFDNDGFIDIAFDTHSRAVCNWDALSQLQVWLGCGSGRPVRATVSFEAAGEDGWPGFELTGPACDVDGDGDTDLAYTVEERPGMLLNNGGNGNRQLKVRLVGTRSNRDGIGAIINIRDGDFRVTRYVSSLPIEIGVGPRDRLQEVDVTWTNGVTDAALDVDVSKPLVMTETLTAVGSCPYLYAWDGSTMRFVTDILGASPLGLPLRRGAIIPADTDELVRIGDASAFAPRDGRYVLSVTDEMREIIYLDKAELWAVDHPPQVETAPSDTLRPPPFPPSAVHLFTNARAPVAASVDATESHRAANLHDRAATVRERDAAAAQDASPDTGQSLDALAREDDRRIGPLRLRPPQLRGLAEPHTITLEFDSFDGYRRPALLLTGWIQWGDASVNVAAGENPDLPNPAPRLEYEDADGAWQPIDVVFGLPAGKTKRTFCDLTGKLPRGVRRLRLTHGFELFWDRIAIAESLGPATGPAARTATRDPTTAAVVHKIAAASADLRERGFSRMDRARADQPMSPTYDDAGPGRQWPHTPEGWATRCGDVRPLLTDVDDRYVVMTGGDEVRLEFDASALPPLRAGWVREFYFYSDGWDKDADAQVAAGQTIEPLPWHAQPAADYGRPGHHRPTEPWMAEYLTRRIEAGEHQLSGVMGRATR